MLSEAASLEHMIMCQYLFAAFSLKRDVSEGVTAAQLEAITRWERQVSLVATQEMLHLTLVNNLLSSIGSIPFFGRPNFPQHARYYPPGVQLSLLPFGRGALQHFLFLERPEGMDLQDAPDFEVLAIPKPSLVIDTGQIVPQTQQPVEKVQVISSFYPWRAKLERKWQHGRKICSSIVDFFNRLLRFLPISRAISLCGKRGAFPRTPSTSRGSGEVRIQHK